jgi:SPRY domain-containing SOCS box protein 3
MTIFNANKNETTKFENNGTLRSLLFTSTSTTPSTTKPIQIKNDTNCGGHHFMPNHLQQNYLDASCLTKAKLNECLNNIKPVKYQQQENQEQITRVPFKSHKPLDWSWSHEMESGCNVDSPPFLLSNDAKSVCFHPYCMGCFETNAVRGNKPLKLNAFTYWEISLEEGVCAGTSVMVGIGRSNAKLNSNGYINLIGADANSWGLSNKGQLWHDNQSRLYCHSLDDMKSSKGIRIGCLFDGYNGRLAFFKNGVCLGVAFENLLNINEYDGLYPMVSSTVSKSVIRLEVACENFATLKEMCRERVQQQIMERLLLVAGDYEDNKGRDRNFYETFINGQSSLTTYLPKTIVEYLSNK